MNLGRYIDEQIKMVQEGRGPDFSAYPEEMKGEIAKGYWDDPVFRQGMKHGFILAFITLYNDTARLFNKK